MKLICITILACCILGAICKEELPESVINCMQNAGEPCPDKSNTSCADALTIEQQCITDKCESITNQIEIYKCMAETCASKNEAVKKYYDEVYACMNSSFLSVSIALFSVILTLL